MAVTVPPPWQDGPEPVLIVKARADTIARPDPMATWKATLLKINRGAVLSEFGFCRAWRPPEAAGF